ncbi:uncharacterized protein K452DRAFT_119077 [Aplosporella prunicola CBS 121167]|uniref:Uncharacterized protein n=1 Tax=Aplosporella prunicola CBS 121167 TaxID=1176127 RepID=A0A6A6BQ45_9PEZI|nr:uncharacterized protein K452DRAFT_119077 [Aplosporella prunicola CBS 121167]KAF2145364.1 hypothetical protein K452DRAFT_119077 [Aplosporella prunicola CBS 121167]
MFYFVATSLVSLLPDRSSSIKYIAVSYIFQFTISRNQLGVRSHHANQSTCSGTELKTYRRSLRVVRFKQFCSRLSSA